MTNATEIRPEALAPAHPWLGELLLRLFGASLQILSTWALVHALSPEDAGVYFRGFVIALGLSTLLRGKYEIYMAQRILGRHAIKTETSNGALLMQLAGRVLLRSSLLCAVLLVLTADVDIQAPQLQTVLQTYLPFVLALPCVSLSGFFGEALRAANRTLGIVVATYAVNLSILLAVALAPPGSPLALYSWAFFLGSVVAAAAAVWLAWQVFRVSLREASLPISREVLLAVDAREAVGLARGAQLWGPVCILSIFATALQMAQYAAAARTAQIVDYFLPSLNLTGGRETLSAKPSLQAVDRLPIMRLVTALLYSCALVLPLLLLGSMTLSLYGIPYRLQTTVYALLLGVQWVNGVGRPAVRHAVAHWDLHRIGATVGSGALAAVLVCAIGITRFGALAAAGGSLIGAVILNGRAILIAPWDRASGSPEEGEAP
jgi:hypothetical protein